MPEAKALATLYLCPGSGELSLFTDAMSTKISCAGSCFLNPLYTVKPLKGEDPDEMLHYAAFHQGLHWVKKIFRQKMYNHTSMNMYNGLPQVYCIKPERRNPLVYKGLKKEDYTSSLAFTITCI